MRQYKVLVQTYVPVGTGFKYKKPGQVVTLDDEDAASLGDKIAPVGVQKLNIKPKPAKVTAKVEPDPMEEVSADAGEPSAADGRAVHEAGE